MALPAISAKVDADLVKAADELLQHTGVSGLSATVSNVLGSWIAPLHRENVLRFLSSTRAKWAERSYANRRSVPAGLVSASVRAAAEEDDVVMLDLHAQLLVGFQNADQADAPNRTFITILSEMRPVDFQVLRFLLSAPPPIPPGAMPSPAEVGTALGGVPGANVTLAAQNLVRLACLRLTNIPATDHRPSALPVSPAGSSMRDGHERIYTPLELGVALMDALGEERAPDNPKG